MSKFVVPLQVRIRSVEPVPSTSYHITRTIGSTQSDTSTTGRYPPIGSSIGGSSSDAQLGSIIGIMSGMIIPNSATLEPSAGTVTGMASSQVRPA